MPFLGWRRWERLPLRFLLCLLIAGSVSLAAELTPAEIDRVFRQEAEFGPDPAAPVSDPILLRRLTLDLLGRNPTPAEMEDFLILPEESRWATVIERFLEEEQFGIHWANYWSDTISFRVPPPELTFLDYSRFKNWLAKKLNQNVAWNEITYEILTAKGKIGEHPEASFVGFHQGNPVRLASETSRIFLGIQMECAECHDHPFERWKRDEFHELAGFFVRLEVKLPHNDGYAAEVKSKPVGEHLMPDMKNPKLPGTTMLARTLSGESLEPGREDLDRRTFLAQWLVRSDNAWFSRAYVNRIFYELMGFGFHEPVDNIGGGATPAFSKLFDLLAKEFVDSGYDQKHLIRLLVGTELYRRNQRQEKGYQAKRMSGDQVFDALVGALRIPNITPPSVAPTKEIRFPPPPLSTRGLVTTTFGFDPSAPGEEVQRTMAQAMLLMNGDQILAQINARPESSTMLSEYVAKQPDDEKLVRMLFAHALGRSPTSVEQSIALEHIRSLNDRGAGFEDLLWSLINTAEFSAQR